MARKVLIIQHSYSVPPGYITQFFTEKNVPFEILPIFDSNLQITYPDDNTNDYMAIISLGGPQGTYEDDIYPYLKWEKRFLGAQLSLNTPILGLCLGSQLLADVIGGRGHLGKYGYEVGYVRYELTSEGKNDAVLSKIFDEQQNEPLFVMHHKDTFDLPLNASILAYTSNNYIAAYRYGSALCVQFHPEASFTEFNQWVKNRCKSNPESYGNLDIDQILQQAESYEKQAENSRQLFFKTWWNSIQHNGAQ